MTDLSDLDKLPILFHALNIRQLPIKQQQLIAQIDQVLPQTQCGLCGHVDGCLPYAYGIVVRDEAHNLCVPGGQAVADSIGQLLNQHKVTPALTAKPSKWRNNPTTNRPIDMLAVIDENNCIGCTKCIPACPVDAIIGSAKHMHSIIAELCTGCELCLPPCPVDCIHLIANPKQTTNDERAPKQRQLRRRYHHHLNRVAKNITDGSKPVVNAIESAITNRLYDNQHTHISKDSAKNAIELAKLRSQIKKLNKQLSIKDNDKLRQKLNALSDQLTKLQNS